MLKRVKKEKKISLKTKNKKHKVITKKEKEKGLHDILVSVKRISYEYNRGRPGSDVEAINRVIAGKKALEELSKTHISLD